MSRSSNTDFQSLFEHLSLNGWTSCDKLCLYKIMQRIVAQGIGVKMKNENTDRDICRKLSKASIELFLLTATAEWQLQTKWDCFEYVI